MAETCPGEQPRSLQPACGTAGSAAPAAPGGQGRRDHEVPKGPPCPEEHPAKQSLLGNLPQGLELKMRRYVLRGHRHWIP